MSKQKINNEDKREWFTMMPNIIDESDLDPHEFRLLIHYYRVGNCWEGTRTTAKKCQMSMGTVSKKRRSLAVKGWIVLQEPDEEKPNDTITITIVDKWSENLAYFHSLKDERRSSGEHPVHQVNTPRSLNEHPRSSGERKNTNIKNNNSKNTKDIAANAAPPPPPMTATNGNHALNGHSGKSHPPGSDTPPSRKKEPSEHQQLMKAYHEALGYDPASWGQIRAGAKAILDAGYTVQQAMDCYNHMKREPFWRSKPLSLQSVHNQLGEFMKLQNGNGRIDDIDNEWQSIKIAAAQPGRPNISERALIAIQTHVPGGWRTFKEQDARFFDQLKPVFKEAYERVATTQPA